MHKYLKEYNKVLSQKCNYIGKTSLLSPTLCRVEAQTGLFREIFFKNNNIKLNLRKKISENFGFFLKPFRDYKISKSLKSYPFPKKIKNLFITYADYRNFDNRNIWREEIFRGLYPSNQNIIIAIVNGKKSKDLEKINKFISHCNDNSYIFSNYHFINFSKIVKATIYSFKSYFLILKKLIFQEIKILNRNIKFKLLKKSYLDFTSGRIYTNELYKLTWREINKECIINNIIFPWESQCWERLICNEFYWEKTNIIGYQHTGFSYGLLQHFNTRFDRELNITPHFIFTAGEVQKNILLKYKGFKYTKIIKFGSLRCSSKINPDLINKKISEKIKKIYLCLGYNIFNYDRIIDELKNIDNSIKINVLIHPINKYYIYKNKLEDNIKLITNRDNQDLKKADFLLVDDNSMMIEGWSLGVPTVILESDKFNLSKRDWGSPIVHIALNKLNKIVNKTFINKINKSIDEYIASNYGEKYFNETSINNLFNFIEKINSKKIKRKL